MKMWWGVGIGICEKSKSLKQQVRANQRKENNNNRSQEIATGRELFLNFYVSDRIAS